MSQEITDANFNQIIKSNKVAVITFSAKWCGPCQGLAPAIEQLSTQFNGKAVIGKIDVDINPASVAKYGIRNIPAILFFKNGHKVDKMGAGITGGMIADKINSLL